MSIDFEIPAEAKAIREKVRKWVHDECIPAEKELDSRPFDEVLGKLRAKARAQGLWCPFVPKEYGGMGLGPLANALVQMELGESYLGALALNDIWFGGQTMNPWLLEEGASGSSAGPGAATAAALVAFAIGSETGGSIVSPSMRCGITGLRPTFGRVPRTGAMTVA